MMDENLSEEFIEWKEGFKIEQRYHISVGSRFVCWQREVDTTVIERLGITHGKEIHLCHSHSEPFSL